MKKTVAIFSDYDQALKASNVLLSHNIADYTLTELSSDFEQQLRQEIFLSHREARTTFWGALIGSLLLGLLFYWLVQNHGFGYLYARLLAGTVRAATFIGSGIGFAVGGLLAGLYALSRPLGRDFSGHWVMVLYTDGLEQFHTAREILDNTKAVLP